MVISKEDDFKIVKSAFIQLCLNHRAELDHLIAEGRKKFIEGTNG